VAYLGDMTFEFFITKRTRIPAGPEWLHGIEYDGDGSKLIAQRPALDPAGHIP